LFRFVGGNAKHSFWKPSPHTQDEASTERWLRLLVDIAVGHYTNVLGQMEKVSGADEGLGLCRLNQPN
jgi:hypothetical protein